MSILRLRRRILDTIESYLLEFMTVLNQLDVKPTAWRILLDKKFCLSHSTVRRSPKLLAESVGARCDTYGGIWRRLPCRARLWSRPWTPTARSPSLCTPSGCQSRSLTTWVCHGNRSDSCAGSSFPGYDESTSHLSSLMTSHETLGPIPRSPISLIVDEVQTFLQLCSLNMRFSEFSTKTTALQSWKPDERLWCFFV